MNRFGLISLLVLLSFSAVAQYRMMGGSWEMGLFVGGSNYLGDLAPDLVLPETHPAAGFFIKRNLSPFFAMGIDARYGTISGADANFESQKVRNLSFRSHILEISPRIELNFFRFRIGLGTKSFTPYIY